MHRLRPPTGKLRNVLEMWKEKEVDVPWIDNGFAPVARIHKSAIERRQWDTEDDVLEDEIESSAARIMGECVEALEPVERALLMYGACGIRSAWVERMEPARAQARYDAAMLKLAGLARRAGVDV